jgi:diguanylate cyclase (GGDEF)-like protein
VEPALSLRVPFLFAVSIFYGYFVQLTQHQRIRKAKIREAARIDALTGLLNRGTMEKEVKKEFERARRYQRDVALLMLDVDDFEAVNETYGRSWGDRVLQTISRHLRENLRESDVAGKYGEEGFVVVLPESDLEESLRTAERVCRTIRQTIFETTEGDFCVTASIGITSTSEKEYEDYREMLSEAERMLYVAKHSGKDRIEPSRPGMHDLVMDGLADRKLLH